MRRVQAFTGPDAERNAEASGHWLRALAGNGPSQRFCVTAGIPLTKAGAEIPDSAGGFLVPTFFDAAIINVREKVGAFRQGAEVRTVTSSLSIRPRRTGGVTANFVDEGASIPESSFQAAAIEPVLQKLAVLVRASSELYEDEAIGLAEFVANEIGYAFAATEDDCAFNGDGTSAFRGTVGLSARLTGTKSAVAAAATHDLYSEIDNSDIGNLIAGVMGSALPGAAWYCSPSAYALTFCRLAVTSGGLVTTTDAAGNISASYLGWPIRFSSKLPDVGTTLGAKAMLYFGNLAMSSTLVQRGQMVMAMSRQRLLEDDQVLLRGTERIDLITHTTGDATTRGPIAMLVGTT
jgi:HK97 family phage major capsid protein